MSSILGAADSSAASSVACQSLLAVVGARARVRKVQAGLAGDDGSGAVLAVPTLSEGEGAVTLLAVLLTGMYSVSHDNTTARGGSGRVSGRD